MKGWGAQDDFQIQIEQTMSDLVSIVRSDLLGDGQADCEDCGNEIPAKRREAYPSCIRCIHCATLFEQFKFRR